jgi:hypothetical protein
MVSRPPARGSMSSCASASHPFFQLQRRGAVPRVSLIEGIMTEEQDEPQASAPKKPVKRFKGFKPRKIRISKPAEAAREQSSIGFPYQDLDAGISVARAMLQGGGVALSRDQLAGVMNQSVGSGSFVTKVATARLFGLIAANNSKYELTDIGFEILDSDATRQKSARAAAFLSVPLYKKVYDEFRGKQLPPRPHGLEQAFVRFGVSAKQKTNARLAFDKSANQAGFFPNGPDRLIEPILGVAPRSSESRPPVTDEMDLPEDGFAVVKKREPENSGYHPFIQGLLDTLPAPQTNWTIEGRATWLQAAAKIFDLIYQGSGNIEIVAKPQEPKSE